MAIGPTWQSHSMVKRTSVIVITALMGLVFLGAGCRPQPPASPVNSGAGAPPANTAPAPDPLADDLDAAIEDLNAIE